MMKRFKILLTSKIFIFIEQILIISVLIYFFQYEFYLNLDWSISNERRYIIQFIANYIIFDLNNNFSVIFIIGSWLLISIIPILIFRNYKKAYSMNLTTFFFPNFFFYVFLYRYSPNYFDVNFYLLFTQSVILGILIFLFSIGLTFIIKKVIATNEGFQYESLEKIINKIKSVCPHCGTKFDSIPKYCYNCLKELSINIQNENP